MATPLSLVLDLYLVQSGGRLGMIYCKVVDGTLKRPARPYRVSRNPQYQSPFPGSREQFL